MIKPSVLMLDEPPWSFTNSYGWVIWSYSKSEKTNVAILMVEQNAKQALSISDRGYVLVTGENRYFGTGKELLNDQRLEALFRSLKWFFNAIILLLNYLFVPALSYGSQLALGAIFVH